MEAAGYSAAMFHLLVMACTEGAVCAERWLPAADRPTEAACLAAAGAVAPAWLTTHAMTARDQRCVPTEALPTLPLQPVAPGIWVHRGTDAAASPQNGGRIANLGVITGPSGTILIDTGGNRAEAEALMAAALRLSPQPVVAAIVTHVHPDHTLGTGLLHEAGVPILGHADLPAALAARRATYETAYATTIGAQAWHGSGFALPDRTFASRMTLTLGGRALTLLPEEVAHTDSDMTVLDGDTGTLFAGDLAFRGLTPTLDGAISGWRDVLGHPPQAGRVVPGHGPVAADWAEATAETRGYLDALAGAVLDAIADNLSLGQAVPVVVEALRGRFGTLADFDDTTRRNAAAAFKELEWE